MRTSWQAIIGVGQINLCTIFWGPLRDCLICGYSSKNCCVFQLSSQTAKLIDQCKRCVIHLCCADLTKDCSCTKQIMLIRCQSILAKHLPLPSPNIFLALCLVVNSNKNEQDCSAVISVKDDVAKPFDRLFAKALQQIIWWQSVFLDDLVKRMLRFLLPFFMVQHIKYFFLTQHGMTWSSITEWFFTFSHSTA